MPYTIAYVANPSSRNIRFHFIFCIKQCQIIRQILPRKFNAECSGGDVCNLVINHCRAIETLGINNPCRRGDKFPLIHSMVRDWSIPLTMPVHKLEKKG